jgi:hypothetical protein
VDRRILLLGRKHGLCADQARSETRRKIAGHQRLTRIMSQTEKVGLYSTVEDQNDKEVVQMLSR